MLKNIFVFTILIIFITPAYAFQEKKELTLDKALSEAISTNNELKILLFENSIIDAKIIQTNLLQNPELSSNLENIGGSPEITGGYQLTVQISQPLESDEKRESRVKLISTEKEINKLQHNIKLGQILSDVKQAFIEVLFNQEQVKLVEEKSKIAQNIYFTVSEIVKAGKASPFEQTKAKINLEEIKIEQENIKISFEFSKIKLALLVGKKEPDFASVKGNFYTIPDFLTLDNLFSQLADNPRIEVFNAEVVKHQAMIDVEKKKTKPDITLLGGYRLFDVTKTGNVSLVTGVSLPIPIFNNNQGTIMETEYQINKLQTEKKVLENSLKIVLIQLYKDYLTSLNEIESIKKNIIPNSESIFKRVIEGYQAGKLNYLELLEAQKILFEPKQRYIKTLITHHKSFIEIDKLIMKGTK